MASWVGNTIAGFDKGVPFFEYINPNGTVSDQDASKVYKGEWWLDGDLYCAKYGDYKTCVTFYYNDKLQKFVKIRPDGTFEGTPDTIIKGNPQGL